jgi:hypothetical protein
MAIEENLKKELKAYFKSHKKPELLETYLFYLEHKYPIAPVLFPFEKRIYQNLDHLISKLEANGKLWRETEIKVQFGKQNVNKETQKIYICPFSGKAFGDNTCLNPQDAIYDWVSKCPENKERANGMKVKRFFVSEDPKVIAEYIEERKDPIVKTVFSSAVSGKLFNSKKAVIDDFKANYIKKMSLVEVQSQNRFEIDEEFLAFIKSHLSQERVAQFVEDLSEDGSFEDSIAHWF